MCFFTPHLGSFIFWIFGWNEKIWINIIIIFSPIFFTTRYIWFEKSRNRIFYGLFNFFKKFELRTYETKSNAYETKSNADEIRKYAELRDKGIITEEEFQSKKKKLLDL